MHDDEEMLVVRRLVLVVPVERLLQFQQLVHLHCTAHGNSVANTKPTGQRSRQQRERCRALETRSGRGTGGHWTLGIPSDTSCTCARRSAAAAAGPSSRQSLPTRSDSRPSPVAAAAASPSRLHWTIARVKACCSSLSAACTAARVEEEAVGKQVFEFTMSQLREQ